MDLKGIKTQNFDEFNEIVLLINPIDFDKIYGINSALLLYNYLSGLNNKLRTTLFSEARNLYSFYDANVIPQENSNKYIYLKTIPHCSQKDYLYFSYPEY